METGIKEKFDKLVKNARQALRLVDSAPKINFNKIIKENWRARPGVAEYPGVYIIYKGNKIIYIGSAGKGNHVLRFRIGDLFFYSESPRTDYRFHHYLSRKLIEKGEFKTIGDLRNFYLNKCKIKLIETESIKEARAIEYILIAIFQPKYNA